MAKKRKAARPAPKGRKNLRLVVKELEKSLNLQVANASGESLHCATYCDCTLEYVR